MSPLFPRYSTSMHLHLQYLRYCSWVSEAAVTCCTLADTSTSSADEHLTFLRGVKLFCQLCRFSFKTRLNVHRCLIFQLLLTPWSLNVIMQLWIWQFFWSLLILQDYRLAYKTSKKMLKLSKCDITLIKTGLYFGDH